jgi:hypothetical protein
LGLVAAGAAVVVLALAAVYLWPDEKAKSVTLGEPLKLRLETSLRADKP